MEIATANKRAYQLNGLVAARNRNLVLEVLGSVLSIVYETASFVLSVRTNPQTTLTLTNSDGSSDVFSNSITKNYADASRRSSSLDTDRNAIDIINIDSAGTVSLNGPAGTVDFTAFPNLVQARCRYSYCNVFKINTVYGLDIQVPQCAGQTLDLSEAKASSINASNSLCNNVVWPALGTGELILGGHAITSPQYLPPIPGLTQLYVDGSRAATSAGIGTFDLSRNPQIGGLYLRQSRVNNLVTVPNNALGYMDVIYTDFSNSYPGQPGNPGSLATLLSNSPNLYRIDGYNCGLDADTLEQILDITLATHPRVLVLGGGGLANHYLNTGGIGGRVCEPLVTTEAQEKLAAVRAAGSYIEVNDPVFYATQIDDYTHRLDYVSGTKDCTWWGPNDTFNCVQSFNSDLFSYGTHHIISGGGKSWIVTNTTNYPGRTGDRGFVMMRKG